MKLLKKLHYNGSEESKEEGSPEKEARIVSFSTSIKDLRVAGVFVWRRVWGIANGQ
jgi:hypothetical protein